MFDMYGYAAGGSGRPATMMVDDTVDTVDTVSTVDTVDTVERTKGDLAAGSQTKAMHCIVLVCYHSWANSIVCF